MLAPSPKPQFIIQTGDCRALLKTYPEKSVHCCVTSPPYFGLRDYGVDGQIGLEKTPDAFVAEMVAVFREVHRVLRDDGTLWLNLGDSYARAAAKGGSGPGGKNEDRWGYGVAQSAKMGSSDGAVGPADRSGSRSIGEGLKPKDIIGIPWRVAFALQADGWYLRQDIIWHKPNPMPESVTDRCTKAHEYIFMLSKSERYFYDHEAVREEAVCKKMPGRGMTDTRRTYGAQNGGNSGLVALRNRLNDQGEPDQTRNRRSVWTVTTQPYKGAHFATFPPALIEPCILAGCPPRGIVLDPFGGAGTTGLVATQNGRRALLIELNPDYAAMADKRIREPT